MGKETNEKQNKQKIQVFFKLRVITEITSTLVVMLMHGNFLVHAILFIFLYILNFRGK